MLRTISQNKAVAKRHLGPQKPLVNYYFPIIGGPIDPYTNTISYYNIQKKSSEQLIAERLMELFELQPDADDLVSPNLSQTTITNVLLLFPVFVEMFPYIEDIDDMEITSEGAFQVEFRSNGISYIIGIGKTKVNLLVTKRDEILFCKNNLRPNTAELIKNINKAKAIFMQLPRFIQNSKRRNLVV